jgi:hypothetical protein
LLQA